MLEYCVHIQRGTLNSNNMISILQTVFLVAYKIVTLNKRKRVKISQYTKKGKGTTQ